MCLNCGCGMPNESHGHEENITLDDVRRAGEVNDQSLEESLRNMGQTARQAMASGESSGQPGGQSQHGGG